MLDDLRKIHERDPQDALGVAEKQWQQLVQDFECDVEPRTFANIVLSGMGGSALSAYTAQDWLSLNVPFEICRSYDAPGYVGPDTLFIASSHSGNTEETLSALKQAMEKQATIVVIASGGELERIARESGYTFLRLPANFQPRQVVFAGLKALAVLFDAYGLTDGAVTELTTVSTKLQAGAASYVPTQPTAQNLAKQIALECMGKSVVIYSGPKLASAAYKWKISVNENAKQIAWWNQYSEFNHNEFLGWTGAPEQKPYTVIELRSILEHPQIQKRFEISAKLLSGKRPAPIVVEAEGETALEQLLRTMVLGDFVAIYLALLGNVNPTPIDLIERLKHDLIS
jgi:glucose/mannose-6-phosphate isomerase